MATVPRYESQSLTGVGPQRHVSLPAEVWQLIIEALDDHCFVWFVLRRVSPFHKAVTEDVFARYVLHTCNIRFAGEMLRHLLTL